MTPAKNIHKNGKFLWNTRKYYGTWGKCKGVCKNGSLCTNRAKYYVNGNPTGLVTTQETV